MWCYENVEKGKSGVLRKITDEVPSFLEIMNTLITQFSVEPGSHHSEKKQFDTAHECDRIILSQHKQSLERRRAMNTLTRDDVYRSFMVISNSGN